MAVYRHFEIFGEALAALRRADADLAATIPDLPRIVAFRNIFTSGYAAVDDELVWGRVEVDLPRLIEALTDERIAVDASINPSPPTVTPSCPVKTMKFINFPSAAATNENAPLVTILPEAQHRLNSVGAGVTYSYQSYAGASLEKMIVPDAANIPPTPWQTEIFAPSICAGDVPRICRTLSCSAYMPYMPECIYDNPPPLVFNGNFPPGAVLRSAMNAAASPRGTNPRSSKP